MSNKKMTLTRIASLRGFDNVLLGRDISSMLTPGRVYGVHKLYDGRLIMEDLGEHAELEKGNDIGGHAMQGTYLLTKEERKVELEHKK